MKNKKTKWESFDEFVSILREYVENEYFGGLECKIEKGKIVDSKDWRKRKFRENDVS